MKEAFVYDAIRTPRGRGKRGSLYEVKPVTMVTQLLGALQDRNNFDTAEVEDLILGCVTPVGDQGGNIAKAAINASGWSCNTAGIQLNRYCASGLEAVNSAAARIRSGWEDLIVAGGVESMSRIPMGADGGPWAFDPKTSLDTNFVPQGVAADLIATLDNVGREEVDAYAARSHQRAADATRNGYFAKSLVPVLDPVGQPIIVADEHIRPGTTIESLKELKPSFEMPGEVGFDIVAQQRYPHVEKVHHVHTAGNSSGVVDGASLVLIGSEEAGQRHGLKPRARIVSTALVGTEPTIMLTGPVPAARKALDKAGLSLAEIDLFEVNEAFAIIPMRFMRDLQIPLEKVNVNGGAIALGHPLGATGAMLLGTLIDELERRDLRYGLATLCAGGGIGIATIVERL